MWGNYLARDKQTSVWHTYLPIYLHTYTLPYYPASTTTLHAQKPVVVDKGYKTAQATASPCSFSALALRGREAVSLHQRGANPRLMHLHAASQLHLQMVLLARRHRGRQSSASEQSMGFGLAFLMRIIGLDYEIGADDHLNWEDEHLKRCRSAESVSVQFLKKKEDCFIFQSRLIVTPNL